MTGPDPDLPADDASCPGIRILSMEIDPFHSLVVVLTEPLGCPSCGQSGTRWVVPAFQDRMFHRRRPGDPGE